MHAILTALGFRPVFRYEKFRAEWSDGTGEVVIDHTPIGDLAEIEGGPEWIDRIANLLGISERDYITASYAELFFRLEGAHRQRRSPHDLRAVRPAPLADPATVCNSCVDADKKQRARFQARCSLPTILVFLLFLFLCCPSASRSFSSAAPEPLLCPRAELQDDRRRPVREHAVRSRQAGRRTCQAGAGPQDARSRVPVVSPDVQPELPESQDALPGPEQLEAGGGTGRARGWRGGSRSRRTLQAALQAVFQRSRCSRSRRSVPPAPVQVAAEGSRSGGRPC